MELIEFLESNNIEYWQGGKNVSSGYINIQCVFCDDTSNHLGINKKSLKCNCWKCGSHTFVDLVMEIKSCSLKDAKEIFKSISKGDFYEENIVEKTDLTLKFPKNATKIFPKQHLKYLKKRGFNPNRIIRDFDLYACGFDNQDYKFRIIIPIYQMGKMVSFTTRDITGRADIPYKTAKPSESLIRPKECIFNIDTIRPGKDLILTEGPFDVMKFGQGAICFLGVKLTDERILQLSNKMIDRLFIIYDNDPMTKTGQKSSKRIFEVLKFHIRKIVVVSLNKHKDLGQMSFDEIQELKRSLNFNY